MSKVTIENVMGTYTRVQRSPNARKAIRQPRLTPYPGDTVDPLVYSAAQALAGYID